MVGVLEMTDGQTFAKAICKYMSIGPTTKRYRRIKGSHFDHDLHADILANVEIAATDPKFFSSTEQASALALAIAPVRSHRKHVQGCRINGTKIAKIQSLTAWQFVQYLASMIDAGITNVGEAEEFYRKMEI